MVAPRWAQLFAAQETFRKYSRPRQGRGHRGRWWAGTIPSLPWVCRSIVQGASTVRPTRMGQGGGQDANSPVFWRLQ